MTEAPTQQQTTITEKELAQHSGVIRNYLRRILRKDEIEDGVQTVLARALENLDRYRGEGSPRVWLLGIARNVGYELARARQRRPMLMNDHQEDAPNVGDAHPSPEASQEEALGDKEEQALVLEALEEMSLDEKLVLLITYFDHVAGPDAAELLGISFAAFRQRLSRARTALGKRLEELKKEGRPGSAAVTARWQPLLNPQKKAPSRGASRAKKHP